MKDGYYWLTSERSTLPSIAQCIGRRWYLVGEQGYHSLEEVHRRGWEVHARVKRQNRQYPRGER
jgi:hypothetical protein